MRKTNWMLPEYGGEGFDTAAEALAKDLGICRPTAALLCARGMGSVSQAEDFFSCSGECLHDPFEMADMENAVARIEKALRQGEAITIYGDYDVDGVTSVSILYLYLKKHGGRVAYYIPDRLQEGYGVNAAAITRLAENGTRLMITVDTGITAFEEVRYAKELGIDTVITDHHSCRGEIPTAEAVVNPMREDCTYPFSQLAGVGVVFKLLCALECRLGTAGDSKRLIYDRMMEQYGDLVAIGTVADVMPLTDENRYIVSAGLAVAAEHPRPGLSALLEAAQGGDKTKQGRRPLTTGTVSFMLAPRINAAGRMASAEKAVQLFLTDSAELAAVIADELCSLNRLRQEEENKILSQAEAQIAARRRPEDRALVLAGDGWHHGVIGIVSSRITERYHLPSILISFDGEMGKGSGRSLPGVSLMEGLQHCEDLLVQYGGHELAAGLSIRRDQLAAFAARIGEYAAAAMPEVESESTLPVDLILRPEEITLRQASELQRFEPFGIANPQPQFLTERLRVSAVIPLSGGKHTKLLLDAGEGTPLLTVLCFNRSPAGLGFRAGDRLSLLYTLSVNEFRGSSSAQMLLKDAVFEPDTLAGIKAEEQAYASLVGEEDYIPTEDFFPTREESAAMYRRLRQTVSEEQPELCCRTFAVVGEDGQELSYLKRRAILDIFAQTGILSLEEEQTLPYRARVQLHSLQGKVKFDKSFLYRRLRQKWLRLQEPRSEGTV